MTDIEGSTTILDRLGERYRDLLNDVRGILRDGVKRCGGTEIDARADEFFAVFETAVDAIHAAIAVQRAMSERSWPDDLEVCVRMGIHSGEPTLTDVGYIGMPVHAAARVCSAGHGGQIIVSGQTREATAGMLPNGIVLRTLGLHRLRGVPDAQELFQVEAPGLRSTFPPPNTGGRVSP
jgi:class 3 adenylate cyclase